MLPPTICFDLRHPDGPPQWHQMLVVLNPEGNDRTGTVRPGAGKYRLIDLVPGDWVIYQEQPHEILSVSRWPR